MAESDGLNLPDTVKDVGIAIGSVVIVFLLTFAYSGNWPPMVVIESGSMEHDENPLYPEPRYSHIGVIDTGDLVVVKKAEKKDIVTYLEGKKTDYKKYGDYGDVIVYYKNGIETYNGQPVTPVIHRAMAWVDVLDNGTYYIPEINIYFEGKIILSEIGLPDAQHSLSNLESSGYITKGDSYPGNKFPDQFGHYDIKGKRVQPVDPDWVVGMARGELPWFGLIKLRVTQPDNYYEAPPECRTMLWVSMIMVLVGPFLAGKVWETYQDRRVAGTKPKSDKKKEDGARYKLDSAHYHQLLQEKLKNDKDETENDETENDETENKGENTNITNVYITDSVVNRSNFGESKDDEKKKSKR